MRLCIVHDRLGRDIATELATLAPGIEVLAVNRAEELPPTWLNADIVVTKTWSPAMPNFPRLRWVQLTGVGHEPEILASVPSDVIVTHAGDVPAVATAEFVLMAVLSFVKRTHELLANQALHLWAVPAMRSLHGDRMVLVGLGNIGREVAIRLAPFGVELTAVTRRGNPSSLVNHVYGPERIKEAVAGRDHLVVAVPDDASTRGLISGDVLEALAPRATVVNVGRAASIDIEAVVDRLLAGSLAGALLDVHNEEPLPSDSPLWDVDNLWVTPHCAHRFPEESAGLARLVVSNLARLGEGKQLLNRVELPN